MNKNSKRKSLRRKVPLMNKNSKRKSLRRKSPLMKKNSKRKSLRKKSPLMKKNSKRKSLRKKSSMKRKNEEIQHIIRPDSFSIENEYLLYFFSLLKEKEEHCGYLVIENYNIHNGFFNLKPADEHNKGEEITNKGDSVTCHDIILVDENINIYPPCRWHTHPIYANPYPSPTDMFHLIAIKELDTSIIFTTLGIWEIYYEGEIIWNNLTEEQKEKCSRDIMDRMLVINNIFYHFLSGYFYFLPKYNDTIIENKISKKFLMYYVTEYIKKIRSQFKIQLNFSLWGDNINNDYKFKSPTISKNSLIEFNEILKNPNIQRFKHK